MFGKSVPLIAIVLVGLLTIGASAALLDYYGRVTLTGNVLQSVTIDNPSYTLTGVHGGETVCVEHQISNAADVDIPAWLNIYYEDGITVEFKNTLDLTSKDSDTWAITSDMKATIVYRVMKPTFVYKIDATGLETEEEYVLIYYADQPERFTVWGGAPALELGSWTATASGEIHEFEFCDTGDMPYANDWNNRPPADYTASPDGYPHRTGAKLWLIPSDCYNGDDVVVSWEPDRFLFETDLIRYFQDNNDKLTVPAEDYLIFDFCYTFPAEYVGSTDILISLDPAP